MIDPLELHAYADGQLSKQDEGRVRASLKQDAAAQAELDSILSLKKALHSVDAVECSAAWAKCVGRLDELDKANRTESFVGRYAWALCGVFFLCILGGGMFNRMSPGSQMQAADVARAAASLTPAAGPRSQEPAEVAHFLDDLVGKASKSLTPDRLQVVNGATGEVDGHRVSKLGLHDADGDLCLIIINDVLDLSNLKQASDPNFRVGSLQGMNSVAWTENNVTMILAGNRPFDALVSAATTKLLR
ncbi:hypothetical protein BH11ARM1_BH11ARM1_17760 [soil metagenome]